jgi:hypothetical protein
MSDVLTRLLEARINLQVARLRVLAARTALMAHRTGRFALVSDEPDETARLASRPALVHRPR